MGSFFGSLLGAGANILGGIFGQQNNQANIDAQKQINAQNIALQKEFAQSGLLWKAEDAVNAENATGINKLAMIGAPTSSFSNLVAPQSENVMGKAVSAAGQDLSRAAEALAPETIRRATLENDLLEAKIANVRSDTISNQAAASRTAIKAQPAQPAPLFMTVPGRRGEPVEIINPKYATSFQTPASWPTQAGIALSSIPEMGVNYYKYLHDKVFPNLYGGFSELRGDARRKMQNFKLPDLDFGGLGY